MTETSYEDDEEIMAEVRRVRDEIYAEFGDDFDAYSPHLREVEKRLHAEGWTFVDPPLRPARRPRPDAA